MVEILASVGFAVAMGFVASGICASGYGLVTNSPLKFEAGASRPRLHSVRVALLLVGGPLVIMRNAILGAKRNLRPRVWLVATTILASCWSFCLGLAAINILVLLGVAG